MYSSLFGFQNREAQLRPIAAKRKAARPICSKQSCDDISLNPPPPYSKLPSNRHVAVAMTSGPDTGLGTKILLALRELHIESHLIVLKEAGGDSQSARMQDVQVHSLADNLLSEAEFDDAMFRGTLPLDAMVVVPCDNRRLASIATGLGDDTITRVARLTLARHQGLALIFGENPHTETNQKHLTKIRKEGGIVVPPASTFSEEPVSVDRAADEIVRSVLDGLFDGGGSGRN